jgi:hypothetical protein
MTLRKAALLLLILSLGTCNQAIMVAPPGSNFAGGLIANPEFIAAHGDVSVISGLLMDGTGNPVPDGTVVQFFTNLGRIDEQGKTNDGVVRVNLVSDSRSGNANVQAFSGGDVTANPSFIDPPVAGFSAGSITGGTAVGAAATSASVTVHIGSARPHTVIVTAPVIRITTGGAVAINARVLDEFGNPVTNVPVTFAISATTGGVVARLDSGGQPIFTNNNGEATDILRTNSLLSGTVTVTAITPTGQSGSVTVLVN